MNLDINKLNEISTIAKHYERMSETAKARRALWVELHKTIFTSINKVVEVIENNSSYFNNDISVELINASTPKKAAIVVECGLMDVLGNQSEYGFKIIYHPIANGLISIRGYSHCFNKDDRQIVFEKLVEPSDLLVSFLDDFQHVLETVQKTSYLFITTSE